MAENISAPISKKDLWKLTHNTGLPRNSEPIKEKIRCQDSVAHQERKPEKEECFPADLTSKKFD